MLLRRGLSQTLNITYVTSYASVLPDSARFLSLLYPLSTLVRCIVSFSVIHTCCSTPAFLFVLYYRVPLLYEPLVVFSPDLPLDRPNTTYARIGGLV